MGACRQGRGFSFGWVGWESCLQGDEHCLTVTKRCAAYLLFGRPARPGILNGMPTVVRRGLGPSLAAGRHTGMMGIET